MRFLSQNSEWLGFFWLCKHASVFYMRWALHSKPFDTWYQRFRLRVYTFLIWILPSFSFPLQSLTHFWCSKIFRKQFKPPKRASAWLSSFLQLGANIDLVNILLQFSKVIFIWPLAYFRTAWLFFATHGLESYTCGRTASKCHIE